MQLAALRERDQDVAVGQAELRQVLGHRCRRRFLNGRDSGPPLPGREQPLAFNVRILSRIVGENVDIYRPTARSQLPQVIRTEQEFIHDAADL